jgi:hypothetical protein
MRAIQLADGKVRTKSLNWWQSEVSSVVTASFAKRTNSLSGIDGRTLLSGTSE